MLIEKNLRLVVALAYRNRRKLKSYEIIDVVQDGTIGLMTAIDKYDVSRGTSFSTCAVYWIKQAMGRGIDNFDKTIKLPVHVLEKQRKYITLKNDFVNKGEVLPSDDEWLEILGTTKQTFNIIKNAQQLEVDSLNRTIDNSKGDEESEIGDFVKVEETGYDSVLTKIVNNELLFFLKKYFGYREYYILYYMVLNDEKQTLDEIGRKFGITRERVRQILKKNLEKIRKFYKNGAFHIRNKLTPDELKLVNVIRLEPIEPYNIAKYLYVRDRLTETEKNVLKIYYFGEEKDFIRKIQGSLNVSIFAARELFNSTLKKAKEIVTPEKGLVQDFFHNLVVAFGGNLFNLDLDMDVSEFKKSPRFTYYRWKDKTLDDLFETLKFINLEMPREIFDKLKMFFNDKESDLHPYHLEIALNRIVLDMDRSDKVSNDKLHKVFIDNMDSFNELQLDSLKVYFGEMSRKEFNRLHPSCNYHKINENLINRLHVLYFGLRSYRNYNFNRQKYLSVRDKCFEKMNGYYLGILDTFFGYETGKTITQKELASKLGLTLAKTKDALRAAKLQAGNILAEVNWTISIDKQIYRNYLLNSKIEFKEPTKTIVWDFIVKGKSYSEIASKIGRSALQVSNALTDALWKIDKYRFGLNVDLKRYSLKEAYDFLDLDDLRNVLNDDRVPIDGRNKYFLRAIFGIDMPSVTEELLAQEYDITKRSLVRRIQRSLILIERYKDGEIRGNISYQYDVIPNLKYFTKRDQEFLKLYYKDKLTEQEIADKYQMSFAQARAITNRLRIYLNDILNGDAGFDFNYFWEHIDDNEVPLYGNKNLALKLFLLYYEDGIGANELERMLDIDAGTIRRILLSVTIAFCKRKEGIKKIRDFSITEVKAYFERNKDMMSKTNYEPYYNYISRMEDPIYVSCKCSLPFQVFYDLSKTSPNFVRLADTPRNKIKEIVMENKNALSKRYLLAFSRYLGISSREFMNGKEKNQIISFLMRVDEAILLKRNQGAMRVRKNEQ